MVRKTKKSRKAKQLPSAITFDAQSTYEKATCFYQKGKYQQAEQLCKKIVKIRPYHADALHLLGVFALRRDQAEEALNFIEKAIQSRVRLGQPASAFFLNSLGNALQKLSRFTESAQAYEKALKLKPDFAVAFNNLGNAYIKIERYQDAAQALHNALKFQPRYPEALANLGLVLFKQGQSDRALPFLRQSLELNPSSPETLNNAGLVYSSLGHLKQSEACFLKAIELAPHSAESYNDLASLYGNHHQIEKAVQYYQKAIEQKPGFHAALGNLGNCLLDQGLWQEALTCYSQALEAKPDDYGLRVRMAMVVPAIPASCQEQIAARQRVEQEIATLKNENFQILSPTKNIARTGFFFAYSGRNDLSIQKEIAELYRKCCPSLNKVAAHVNKPVRHSKIRIAFISRYFKNHTIGKFMKGIIAQLDRQRFEVFVFSFPHPPNETESFLKANSQHFVILPLHYQKASETLAAACLDILFYADIGMDFFTKALAFQRFAPFQCVTWGHPVTTGIDTIDAFISAQTLEVDQGQEHYSEKLVKLQRLPTYYFPPSLPQDPLKSRTDFGLDAGANLYLCPQSLFKIHPDFDSVFAEILRLDPKGLVLLFEGTYSQWTSLLQARFARSFPDVARRVQFLPRFRESDFLQLLRLCSVMLDPLHFGGGNTNYEALALDLPIVTLPGSFMRSRVATACYHQMGIETCIAKDRQHYAELAVRLATEPEFCEYARQEIRLSKHLIFEDTAMLTELENVLADAFDQAIGVPNG